MLKTMFEKIKKTFLIISSQQGRERGLVISGTALGIGAGVLALLGTGAWFWREDIAKFTLKGGVGLLLIIANWAFDWSSGIFRNVATSEVLKFAITKDAMVLHGWNIIRSLANMFIVLGFVVVGIATILRIREYEAQKKLLPLIMAAILINFSLVICGVFIDVANITMDYFLGASGPDGIINPLRARLTGPTVVSFIESTKGDFERYVAAVMGFSISLIVSSMIFLLYGLIFIMRPVALMCLVILSPLAFACSALPATKSAFFNKWRDQFVNWVVIGVPTAFFLYLGGHLANATSITSQFGTLDTWIIAAFMLVGYSFVHQSGAMGAAAIMGLAAGGAKWATGKATGLAKGVAGGAAGAAFGKDSKVGQKMGDIKTGMMEKIGLSAPGTMAQREEKRDKDALARARVDFAKNPDRVVSDAKSRGLRPGLKKEDIEARAIIAAENGRLVTDPSAPGYSDPANLRAIGNYKSATARSLNVKEAEAKDPRLARYNEIEIGRLMSPAGGGLSRPDAEEQAINSAYKRLDVPAIQNLSTGALDARGLAQISHKKLASAAEKMSQNKIDHLKQFGTAGTPQEAALIAEEARLRAAGQTREADNLTDHYAGVGTF